MDNIILSQIPAEDLLSMVRQAVREEIAASGVHPPQEGTNDKPVTQSELCEFLGVTEPTILNLRKKKKIPFFLVGTSVRFSKPAVMKALENSKYARGKK